MRRGYAAVVAVMVVGLVVVPTKAEAYASLDSVTAQPANLPLLVEAGMISPEAAAVAAAGGGATAATSSTAVAGVVSGSTGIGSLSTGISAGVALLGAGVAAGFFTPDDDAVLPDGTASAGHFESVGFDPIYVPTSIYAEGEFGFVGFVRPETPSPLARQGWLVCSVAGEDISVMPDPGSTSGRTYKLGPSGGSSNLHTEKYGATGTAGGRYGVQKPCPVGEVPNLVETFGLSGEGPGLPAGVMRWRPGSASSPERHMETTITCQDAAGNRATIVLSGGVSTGKQLETAAGVCPSGSRLIERHDVLRTNGGSEVDLGIRKAPAELSQVPQHCFDAGVSCGLQYEHLLPDGSWHMATPESLGEVDANVGTWRCKMGNPSVGWSVVPLRWCESNFRDAQGVPAPVPPATGAPSAGDGGDESCDLGWSDVLNGSVMVKATSCALAWAFVPKTDLASRTGTVTAAWSASGPGQWAASVWRVPGVLIGGLSGGDVDCGGPHIEWTYRSMHTDLQPVSVCENPGKTLAAATKIILGVVLVVVGAFAAWRPIGKAWGMDAGGPE